MITTSKMGLKVWNLLTDLFDHSQLADNWAALDVHDHTPGKGSLVPTAGLADGAVSTNKLAASAVTLAKLDSSVRPLVTTGVITSDYMAAAGDFVNAGTNAPITITLPPPVKDAIVGVFADTLVTSTNKITVRNHSTEALFGLGFNFATSIVLGSVGSHVVFQSDGANWLLRSGAQDTGWLPLLLGTGITANAFYAPTARLHGDIVRLKGGVQNLSGGTVTPPVFTIPAGLRPSATVFPVGFQYSIATTGVPTASLPNGNVINLDSLTYTLS